MNQELPRTLPILFVRLSGIENFGFIQQVVVEAEHLLILVERWTCWCHDEDALSANLMIEELRSTVATN